MTSAYLKMPLRSEREVVSDMLEQRSIIDRPLNEKLTLMKIMLRFTKDNFKDDHQNI